MTFKTEAELCATYLETVPKGWTAYPETAGFDFVLVHDTGFQVAVEAKLVMNPKVLLQVTESNYWAKQVVGPDCRAVLVGKRHPELSEIADRLHVTVLSVSRRGQYVGYDEQSSKTHVASPKLPRAVNVERVNIHKTWLREDRHWFDLAPPERLRLPEYVPEVPAGVPAPMVLSQWKIQAMKMCQWVDHNKTVTRSDFKTLDLDPGRWMNGYWLEKTEQRGVWRAGSHFPGPHFQSEHPGVWGKIAADFDVWAAKLMPTGTLI